MWGKNLVAEGRTWRSIETLQGMRGMPNTALFIQPANHVSQTLSAAILRVPISAQTPTRDVRV